MKAVCWMGKRDVRVETVPDPTILNPRDAVIKVTSTAICGSDLHLVDGYFPTMLKGDILGHEFMGEVVETGAGVTNLRSGDRVVVPFTISCGYCWFCQKGLWAACDNSNPKAWMTEDLYGLPGSAFFGYGQISGGYAGGQAEYVRVPFADVGPIKIPDGLSDERVLFLGDIFSTAWMAAENCAIEPGDTVAIWGCGPVGLLAIRCAHLLGAEQVISIDRVPERLAMAERAGARTINYELTDDVVEQLKQMTGGRGPDSCIDAVGMEAHGTGKDWYYDRAKQALRITYDRPHVLREAIQACRKAGSVSIPGVYGSFIDKFPMGAVFDKGLTLKSGQTHVQRYLKPLLRRIEQGEIDPSFIITKRIGLEDAPDAYNRFRDKEDGYVKVVITPNTRDQGKRAAVGAGAREESVRG